MRRVQGWWLAAILAWLPSVAAAQEKNHLYDKWQVSGGGTFLIYGTDLRLDPDNPDRDGTTIDAENVLGLESTNFEPRLAARWRMGRRHELEAGFQWADRNAEKVLADTLVVGDTSFAAGLRIKSKLNTSQAFLNYRYAFVARENTMVGAAIGLGPIFLNASIDALAGATAGGPDTTIAQFSQSKSLVGPVASLGLFGRFRVGDKWFIEADARGLYLSVSNIKAEVVELGGAVRYFFSDQWGGELGYGGGWYQVTISRDGTLVDASGRVKYSVQGIRASVIFAP